MQSLRTQTNYGDILGLSRPVDLLVKLERIHHTLIPYEPPWEHSILSCIKLQVSERTERQLRQIRHLIKHLQIVHCKNIRSCLFRAIISQL